MPKPARFTDDDILDAALGGVAAGGPQVTVADIARELHGPVGSIYHRFASREVLMIGLWLRSVRRFQAGLFELASHRDPHHGLLEMALHIPRYCRTHPNEASCLTLYRQERLLLGCPDQVRAAVEHLNDDLLALVREMTIRRYGCDSPDSLTWVVTATRVAPYGLVRPHLGGPIPPQTDEAIAASSDAILRLGDPG